MADDLEARMATLSPAQQRILLGLIRQKSRYSTPTTEGAVGQMSGAPYEQAPLEETDIPLWRQVTNVLMKPFDEIQEHVFTPIAGAVSEQARLSGGSPFSLGAGLQSGLQAGMPGLAAIKGIAQYQPGSEKREAYEQWQAPKYQECGWRMMFLIWNP